MKIEIDRSLFRFELKMLLLNRISLVQLVLLQGYLVYAFLGKKDPAACDALFWTNYGLFISAAVSSMFAAICAGYVLVRPRTCGMTELLLASPLSVRKLVATNMAVCSVFTAVNLVLHLVLVGAAFRVVPSGAGFYIGLAASLSFLLFLILGTTLFSLRTKEVNQMQGALVLLGMTLWAGGFVTKMKADPAAWLAPSLAAIFLLVSAGLWALASRIVSKEKVVLA